MVLPKAVLLKVFAALALAGSAAAATPKTFDAPPSIPSIFNLQGLADAITPLTYTVHVRSQNMAGLASWLESNSRPDASPLSVDDLQQYVAPAAADLTAVQSFLKAQGVQDSAISYNAFKNEVTVKSTVGAAAKAFSAQFNNYKLTNGTVQRTKQYTVPADIADAVELVSPLTSFIQPRTVAPVPTPFGKEEHEMLLLERSTPTAANCSTSSVTPTCLRQYYGSYDFKPTAKSGVTDTFIAGFIGQNFAQSDLTSFLKQYRPEAASTKINVINRAGAANLGLFLLDGAEAMLDTETVASATYPLSSTYFNYGTATTQGDVFQLAMSDIVSNYASYGKPGVYTISYGSDESSVTQAEANTMCNTAMQLNALGTTITVSSGDYGVGGQDGDTCPPFVPTYPSGCQYITSVGATQAFNPEVAVDSSLAGFYSGSGFSNLFARPSFQDSVVSAYKPPAAAVGKYNTSGRAYPDVAAQGSKYAIKYMGIGATVGGTSASAPTFASIIALINSARRAKGSGNIVGLTRQLYTSSAVQAGFKDITGGSSLDCSKEASTGFAAATGWDPVAGFGTPLFDKLRSALGG